MRTDVYYLPIMDASRGGQLCEDVKYLRYMKDGLVQWFYNDKWYTAHMSNVMVVTS